MEREKRQTKPPQEYVIPRVCYPKIRKKKHMKKMPKRAKFQVIPAPMKFTCIATFYVLYSGISLKEHQGSLCRDLRIINQYCEMRGVEVIKEQNFKRIYVTVERKTELQIPAWQNLVEGLLESESNELREWGIRIKNFSLNYEEVQRALSSDEVIFNGMNEKQLLEMTEETEKKISKYLKEYPCFFSTMTTGNNKLREIHFNEQYINELGYSIESFASTTLQQGFPKMFFSKGTMSTKILVDSFFTLGKEGVESPEIISDLVLKSGYLRRVRCKIVYLPSYRNRVYSVTGIMIILKRENKFIQEEAKEDCEFNKIFLKKIIQKEKQINKFMEKFYNKTLNLPYISSHKTCKIRELDIVEKEEPEEESL